MSFPLSPSGASTTASLPGPTSHGNSSSSHNRDLALLAALCDDAAINSSLLHRSNERNAEKLYGLQDRLVTLSRVLAGLSLAAISGAAGLGYYQYAHIFRVWRMRHPKRLQQYFNGTVLLTGFSVTSLLFLISPVGFMAKHDTCERQGREMDALAFDSLSLRQDFATLQALAVLRTPPSTVGSAVHGGRRGVYKPPRGLAVTNSSKDANTHRNSSSDDEEESPERMGIEFRRDVMAINEHAFSLITLKRLAVEEEEADNGNDNDYGSDAVEGRSRSDAVENNINANKRTNTTAAAAMTEETMELKKAELASQLLISSSDSINTSNTSKKDSGTGLTSGSGSSKDAQQQRRRHYYTIRSREAQLWAAYGALNAEWERIVLRQNELAAEAL